MFVEREVAGKTPSIGYAYLTSLVKGDYFHTLFTTNFDDLINEAFYLYSDQRPIVCAHDSSINSITVTSSRPKIIKLHGDYLFDDIKATAKETESLEQNMKSKFTEFAKDFGLIVVGYSGCDRSVMDVISVLLKNDDYLKNGIYWCLRKDSEISDDLKKLLWKDKVFFVEIEGYDELFAEVHSCFNAEGAIPISTSSVSRRPTEIIGKLLSSEYFIKSPSLILRKAYEQLSKESKRTTLMDLIIPRDKEETNSGAEQLSDDELITKLELHNLISTGAYREAIEKGKLSLQSVTKPFLRQEIFKLIIRAHRAVDELREAASVVDELIAEQPYSASHHLLKADILSRHQDKLDSINKAIEVNPHWYRGHYRKAILFFNLSSKCYGKDKENATDEAFKALDKGIAKNPSLDNPCWSTKFDLVSAQEKDKPAKVINQLNIINSLSIMNPESVLVLGLRMSMLSVEKDQPAIKLLIEEINNLKKKTPFGSHPALEEVKLNGLVKMTDIELIKRELEGARLTYDAISDSDLAIAIAKVMRNKLGKDKEAIELLKNCRQTDSFNQDVVNSLIDALIDMSELDDAETIFNKTCKLMTPSRRFDLKLQLLDAKEDFEGALNEIKKWVLLTGKKEYIQQAYFLIKNKKFSESEKLLREYLESIHFSPEAAVEIINFELSCKKQKHKVDQHRLEKVMSFDTSPQLASVVYSILGKKHEMIEHIKKSIINNLTFRFEAKRWPAFDEYKEDPDFIKAITVNP